ncbi:MAG: hypothetical protein CME70_01220 [Halobacteriovorax sp.]|nr:hypothetical protein [Halobacteriovorax sp.]|tara:strand:+ start:49451 stop:49798 length:348 start_codon:yes stop_codon:yes gene_type:complete
MSDEFVGNKEHFKIYLLFCCAVTTPGVLFGLAGVCDASYLLILYYVVAGFPWNFLIVPPLEYLLKSVPPLYEKTEEVCLGPLDALSMSIPVYINIGIIFIVFLFFLGGKKKDKNG